MTARHRIPARIRILAAARYTRWLAPRLWLRWQTWRGCVCPESATCPVHDMQDGSFLALMRLGVHPRHARAFGDVEQEPPADWSPAAEWGDDGELAEVHHPKTLRAPVPARYDRTDLPASGGRQGAEANVPGLVPSSPVTATPAAPSSGPGDDAGDQAGDPIVAIAILNAPLRNQESAWTKRDSAFLQIRLAEEALGRFDNISPYATSGIQARWAS